MDRKQAITQSNKEFADIKVLFEKWIFPLPPEWEVRFTHIFNELHDAGYRLPEPPDKELKQKILQDPNILVTEEALDQILSLLQAPEPSQDRVGEVAQKIFEIWAIRQTVRKE